MHPLFDRLLRFFVLHAYTHCGPTDRLTIELDGWELILRPSETCLVAVFCGLMNAFKDKNSILWVIGTFSDGTTRPLAPTEYSVTPSTGMMAVETTTVDQAIPGGSTTLPAGSSVNTYAAPNTDETVSFSFSGLANGVTVSDLAVTFTDEPVTLTGASATVTQPATI